MRIRQAYNLRKITRTDAEEYCAFMKRNSDRFRVMMPKSDETQWSPDFWRSKIDAWVQSDEQRSALKFVITDDHQSIIGDIGFSNIIGGPFQAGNLGYKIDAEFEGKGIMFDSLNASFDAVQSEIPLRRVMANYMPTNARSGKLLRNLGFVIEGYARDYLYLNEAWEDHILTSRILT